MNTQVSEQMIYMASFGDIQGIKKLISLGYDVNIQNEDKQYPALMAAERNDLEMLKVLIDAGSKVDLEDIYGTTPMFFAKKFKNEKMIRLIEEASPVCQTKLK